MSRRTSPKLIIASLTIVIVLLMNPGNAFAGPPPPGTPVIPTCTPGPDPDGAGPLTQTPSVVPITGVGGIDPGNGGSFSYNAAVDFDFTTGPIPMITVHETWGNSDRSYIMICGLDSGATDYQVKKIITNNTPQDSWLTFHNELLDPSGSTNDLLFDQPSLPYVAILGAAWSHSNELDGLSFAMGTQDLIRTSNFFATVTPNEMGTIDFLNYNNGMPSLFGMNPGDTDNPMSFGLRESQNSEQPFILTQLPNFVVDCELLMNCPIGGEFLGVDTTALLVSGAQLNAAWLIPLVLGTIGIGIVLAKKFRN